MNADKKTFHFEGRYNYEDLGTLSLFAGYNFSFDDKLSVVVTPMIGGAKGNTTAIIPALKFILTYREWILYSEQEYLIDVKEDEGNFYYQWTDLTYSLNDWLDIGLSAQLTRLFQSGPEIDHGIVIGSGSNKFWVQGYLYNHEATD